jgi:ABC-type transport system substrate-binding protein
LLCFGLLTGCEDHPWNDPYPYEKAEANVLYSAFSERPKHLDPARSYSESEYIFIAQIYEPPLQYHYLKRPYTLEPLTAAKMPEVHYLDKEGVRLPDTAKADLIAYTDYIITIKSGVFYQPHPAFAKDTAGDYLYHRLSAKEISHYKILADFKNQGSRELIAEDYVYQIKRLAEPHLSSPIYGIMSQRIVGLKTLREALMNNIQKTGSEQEMDLRSFSLTGVEVLDRYTYKIRIMGKYPQFLYWLAMPFFVPVPWEVAMFYAQPGLQAHNISLDWYPVGTGPFMLSENNPDRRMVLMKNPKFRGETYPDEGLEEDHKSGLLVDAGKSIPMIDKVIFTLEKEEIPRWNKFLQGYYDISGINSDNFGSSVHFAPSGIPAVAGGLNSKGIRLQTSVATDIWFWGFNFLDETIGGHTDKARKIRKAIALAFDVEEYISIFLNGRGILATGPLPPDIFGAVIQPPINTLKTSERIVQAKALLTEAGYSQGLTIHMDSVVTGNPDEIAIQAWLKEQFEKINVNLVIRGTDFNRFQDKVRQGAVQMFFWGWNADYPDPENFLFLFYGPNSSARFGGENMVNYQNPEYDRLFEKMRSMEDSPERLDIIQKMINILEADMPWIWGFHAKSYALYQSWVRIGKPSNVANNILKYSRIDPILRAQQRVLWNQPILWPFCVVLALLLLFIIPAGIRFWRQEHTSRERL